MTEIKSSQKVVVEHSEGVVVGDVVQNVQVQRGEGEAIKEIERIFSELLQRVETMPDGPDKVVARAAVDALQSEAHRGEQAEKSSVRKWLDLLLAVAPDIWRVAVDMFLHPAQGISTVFQKVARRVLEREKK